MPSGRQLFLDIFGEEEVRREGDGEEEVRREGGGSGGGGVIIIYDGIYLSAKPATFTAFLTGWVVYFRNIAPI